MVEVSNDEKQIGDSVLENLKQKKMMLEIEELNCKVKTLQHSEYRRPTFWISVSATLIALVGVLGQGVLSSIKSERAELSVEKAIVEKEEAESYAKEALVARDKAENRKIIAVAESSLANEKRVEAEKMVQSLKNEIKKLEERKRKTELLLNKIVIQIPKLRILAGGAKDPFTTNLFIDELHSIVTKAQYELLAYQIVILEQTKNEKSDLLTLRLRTDPSGQTVFFVPTNDVLALQESSDNTIAQLNAKYDLYTTPAEITVPIGKYVIRTVMNGKVIESIPVDLQQIDSTSSKRGEKD